MVWRCSYGVVNCEVCRRPDLSQSQKRLKCFEDYNRVVPVEHRAYLATRFSEKNTVKGLGARWDAERRQWYADRRQSLEPFSRWLTQRPAPSAGKRAEPTLAPRPALRAEAVSEAEISAMLRTPEPTPIVAPTPVFTFDDIIAATGNVNARTRTTVSGVREVALDMVIETVQVQASARRHA